MNTTSESNSTLLKGILVGALVLAMLIPSLFVSNLVEERQARQTAVVDEISSKWAGKQTVTGPILMLPYLETETLKDGKTKTNTKVAYILPDELQIATNIVPREKKRSLYSVMLYRSDIKLTGKFNTISLESLKINPEAVVWKDARLVINMEDTRGVEDVVKLNWNNTPQLMETGVPDNDLLAVGISAPVALNAKDASTFSVTLSLRGSELLYFTPVGGTTTANISAIWKDPSFDGKYLPLNSSISNDSFQAHWKILPLAKTYPQSWKDGSYDLANSAFGVRLIQTVDGYSKTNRSVKYALLFISLTFAFFFFLEILQKWRIHPLQYLLVGIALLIFYTLLLSISEYSGFNIAYLIAAAATVLLISSYVRGIFQSNKTAIIFASILSCLYVYIFVLIGSEDFALLFGSIGLFAIMATIMYTTRKVDWYGGPTNTEQELPQI
jgi:inner membrane protein